MGVLQSLLKVNLWRDDFELLELLWLLSVVVCANSEDKLELEMYRSELWTTVFRAGLVAKKFERSLSGNYVRFSPIYLIYHNTVLPRNLFLSYII